MFTTSSGNVKMYDSERAPNDVSKLKDLDDLLKCGICYEYLKTTLMTPCSHNYCSYCIRKSLLYKNQCPSCFEDINEPQLRNNRVVDEFISIYVSIKETLLKYVSLLPNLKVSSRNIEVNQETLMEKEAVVFTVNHTDKQSVALNNSNECVNRGNTPTSNAPSTSKKEICIPAMFSPKKAKPSNVNEVKVPCPVCTVEIPEKNINIHLDACLKRSQEKSVPHNEKRKPLPKLVYNLLPDKELRKKLAELSLSTVGDRKTLINRHKRYTLLYNSECDSLNPKSVEEIIKQLKKEEEEEKKTSTQVVKKLNVDRKADSKINEEAQRQYLQEHKSSFQRLVEEARRTQNAKKNSNRTLQDEPQTITLEDNSSETSESEFRIKRPAHKRKCIESDSEEEISEGIVGVTNRIVTQANIHDDKIKLEVAGNTNSSNKENEGMTRTDKGSPKLLSESTDIYDDSTDEVMSEENERAVKDSQEINTGNPRQKRSESDHTLQPSTCTNTAASVTSPVLGTKCRQPRTPSAQRNIDSFKRDLTPGILHEKVSASSSPLVGAIGGQTLENDDADSDSSSNHSASLMMYTGPDCEYDPDQSTSTKSPCKTTIKTPSPTRLAIPISEKCNFDLGIAGILQNSEDFIPEPVRRQSRRIKQIQKSSPVRVASKGNRKRVKIDDL